MSSKFQLRVELTRLFWDMEKNQLDAGETVAALKAIAEIKQQLGIKDNTNVAVSSIQVVNAGRAE